MDTFSEHEEALYMIGYPNNRFRILKGRLSKPWFIMQNWFGPNEYWRFFDTDSSEAWEFPLGGESGSPIFDQGGNIVGIARGSNILGDMFFIPALYLALLLHEHDIALPLPKR